MRKIDLIKELKQKKANYNNLILEFAKERRKLNSIIGKKNKQINDLLDTQRKTQKYIEKIKYLK